MNLLSEQDNILIVDDDKDILQAYQILLKQQNKQVRTCDNPLDAVDIIVKDWAGVVVVDMYMPYLSGTELMAKIHAIDKQIPVIFITGHGDVPMAVNAVKKGAYDFLEKPIEPASFIKKVNQALQERERYLALKFQKEQQINQTLIGESVWVKEIRAQLLAYSLTRLPIYVYGPPSSGKLLAAKQLIPSEQDSYPVEIHNLQQEELSDDFNLWIEKAQNGVLIIQHVDLLTEKYQKVLISHQTQPDKKFRLIVTSCTKPEILAADRVLLPEFYYLFSLTQIECVGLSQRKKDIVIIFEHYLKIACKRLGIKRPAVTEVVKKNLNARAWENNISELINAAELYAVGIFLTKNNEPNFSLNKNLSLERNIEEYEKNLIISALDMYQGRINEAADYLKIPRKKLYLRMKKYQLDKNRFKY